MTSKKSKVEEEPLKKQIKPKVKETKPEDESLSHAF